MNQLYGTQNFSRKAKPSVASRRVPDLISSSDDASTEPTPSPPLAMPVAAGLSYSTFNDFASHQHLGLQPPVHSSAAGSSPLVKEEDEACCSADVDMPNDHTCIEFTDLTQINSDRSPLPRGRSSHPRRDSTTQQDKEAATNMRVRRRAQNRASQRAFRARKEMHVQHLESELELLESRHRHLEQSYSEAEQAKADLALQVGQLKDQLAQWRGTCSACGSSSPAASRSSSSPISSSPTTITSSAMVKDYAKNNSSSSNSTAFSGYYYPNDANNSTSNGLSGSVDAACLLHDSAAGNHALWLGSAPCGGGASGVSDFDGSLLGF